MSDLESLDMQEQSELDARPPGFPGYLLRKAREEKGLSQKETARELHLTSKVIEAIEEDNFEVIPSFVFARGYIRSYARHLGLDGQALVAEFDLAYGVPDHGSLPMSGIRKLGQQTKPSDTWVKVVSILFVIGLVAASVTWWQSQNSDLVLSQLTNVAVETPDGETIIEVLDGGEDVLDLAQLTASQDEVGASVSALEEDEVVAEAIAVETVQAEVTQPIADEEANLEVVSDAALAANQARLVMVFEKDCWVEIKDGAGKMILSDLYSAGEQIDQVVTAPIEVLLGRSSGVTKMTFNGKTIDLVPHTRKDIARLTLSK
ncbi:MAG: DUF4115 domain-containing protein [Gammaproteobacteria bacterium]|nr:DUF4115 domain-containing protein [Gammaproteobacteria bacterium]